MNLNTTHTLHFLNVYILLDFFSFFLFFQTEISAVSFDDFDNGCARCILESLVSSNPFSIAASGIMGCTAVAATANHPQTALWQQKPDLPVPWSLIISTKINADKGHFGRGKGRSACTERVKSPRRRGVSVFVSVSI